MIPRGWQAKRFADIADYKAGRTPARARPDYWQGANEGVPWVAISDMTEFGTVIETKEKITGAAFEQVFRGSVVPAGTLIMSFKLTIGRVATLGIDACHNEAIISIYPRRGVDQRFLGYFLAQVNYDALQDRQVKGNTLNQEKIDRIEIWLPAPEEQAQIADVLDLIKRAILRQEAALQLSEDLKRAAMRVLFTKGMRGQVQKETEIGLVPESWEVVPLGSLGRIGSGTTPDRKNPDFWDKGTVPWITSGRMYEREIADSADCVTEHAIRSSSLPLLKPGAVLIAIVGQGKTLGHCALLQVQATISRHVGYVQPDLAVVLPNFLRGYLDGQYEQLRQLASGNGSTRAALTAGILRSVAIPIPPTLDEQREIVSVLDAIDRKIDMHSRKRAVLDDLFKALLHKLMTGEIRVSDLDLSALAAHPNTEAAA